MKHILAATSVALFLTGGLSPAFSQTAPSQADCEAWFTKADVNADGKLNASENAAFMDAINKTATTKLAAGADLDKATFMDACTKGTLGMPPK